MDFPGVSCEECEGARETDGIEPDCETDKGCIIPPLDEDGKRIMRLRGKLLALKDIVDSGTVLKMHGSTMEDLDLLAEVEETMREAEGMTDGRGTRDEKT